MVAATYENIMMVEGEMHEVSEPELLEAMKVLTKLSRFIAKRRWS